ncbi:hypothetical protein RB601_008981 [Gaeumannomyces tritici]
MSAATATAAVVAEANHCRTMVSIDIGTTFTKCALVHLKPGHEHEIQVVIGYPGDATDPMVPSLLSYSEGDDGELTTYGFLAKGGIAQAESKAIYGMFKNEFPDGMVKPLRGSGPKRSAEELFLAMAQKLLGDIKVFYNKNRHMGAYQAPPWDEANIDFALSVPASAVFADTGTSTYTGKRLRQILIKAGFDSVDGHSVLEDVITESQAAAIYSLYTATSPDIFLVNQTTIVVDAGGGTSDLCVLRVEDPVARTVTLQSVDPIVGVKIGPTWVDRNLEKHLIDFFRQSYCQLHAESAARFIVGDSNLEIRKIKICEGTIPHQALDINVASCPENCEHRKNDKAVDPTRSLIGGLSMGQLAGGKDKVSIENELLKRLFDDEVLGVSRMGRACLKRQLDIMIEDVFVSGKAPDGVVDVGVPTGLAPGNLCVDPILLTSGFGSSPYVHETLKGALLKERDVANAGYAADGMALDPRGNLGPVHLNIKNLEFIVSKEPRLCVCKGVLEYHIKKQEDEKRKSSSSFRKRRSSFRESSSSSRRRSCTNTTRISSSSFRSCTSSFKSRSRSSKSRSNSSRSSCSSSTRSRREGLVSGCGSLGTE